LAVKKCDLHYFSNFILLAWIMHERRMGQGRPQGPWRYVRELANDQPSNGPVARLVHRTGWPWQHASASAGATALVSIGKTPGRRGVQAACGRFGRRNWGMVADMRRDRGIRDRESPQGRRRGWLGRRWGDMVSGKGRVYRLLLKNGFFARRGVLPVTQERLLTRQRCSVGTQKGLCPHWGC
jgi:hypothetical protein